MMQSHAVQQPCFLCGGRLQPYLGHINDHVTGENFEILRCSQCEIGVTDPQPQDLAPYYRAYYGGRHGFTATFRAKQRLALVHKETRGRAGRNLLDVGCGEGTFLFAAREEGWSPWGTEMNPEPARALGLEVFTELTAFQSPREFDCITMWHSLEHLGNPLEAFQSIHRLLKPDGWLFVAVPDAGGWQARSFGRDWLHLDVPRHLYHYGRRSLHLLHERSGFQVRNEHHQELEYDVLGWSQSALNRMFPTRNLFFRQLTGKAEGTSSVERAANWLLGPALSVLALPSTWLGTAFKHGGTLIFASQKS
jgi:2-polyprenyl-3-methyl-5-hydroxy-6-metoxy-1,4-benzoquinol methylase